MPLDIELPILEHKYIKLYDTQDEYEADKVNYEEVCYSIVKSAEATDNNYSEYQYSIRTTNNDNEVMGKYWNMETSNIYAGLEIIWGYFGWEWVDFKWNEEILKGGNFYTIKPMTVVKSIPDGNRLQHINNFITNIDISKITEIEYFDTSNIKYIDKFIYNSTYNNIYMKCNITEFINCEEINNFIIVYSYGRLTFPDDISYINFPKVTKINICYGSDDDNLTLSSTDVKSIFPINVPSLLEINLFAKIKLTGVNDFFNDNIIVSDYIINAINIKKIGFIYLDSGTYGTYNKSLFKLDIDTTNNEITIGSLWVCPRTTATKNIIDTVEINNPNNKIITFNGYSEDNYIFSGFTVNNVIIPPLNTISDININCCLFNNIVFNNEPPYLNEINRNGGHIYENCTFNKGILNFSNDGLIRNNNDFIIDCIFNGDSNIINFGYLDNLSCTWTKEENYDFNEDLTIEGLEYSNPRFVQLNSNFKTIKEQTLENVNIDNSHYIFTSDVLDFVNNNFTIKFETISVRGTLKFFNTPNMTTTPIMEGYLYFENDVNITGKNANIVNLRCANLNLRNRNTSYFKIANFSDKLIYFDIGAWECAIDISKCVNLDIDTLSTSLLRQTDSMSTKTYKQLNIHRSIYEQLSSEVKEHILTCYNSINIVENES